MSFFNFFAEKKHLYKNSIFGFIDNKINELKETVGGYVDIHTDEYKFPEIIIVGDEKNGKSSLLENITKCSIFPKDRAYCTKRPIRFILCNGKETKFSISETDKQFSNVDDVYEFLKSEMKDAELSTKEIVIEYISPENHNFQFVDLPGIKSYPEDQAVKTRSITESYLSNKNNIIVHAYSALTQTDSNCATLSLIKKYNRQEDTVTVVTMLDRLGDKEDVKYIHEQFKEKKNTFFVISNNVNEKKWFGTNGISGNITAVKLLTHVEDLFVGYVNKNWHKNIVTKLTTKRNSLKHEYDDLHKITEKDSENYLKLFYKLLEVSTQTTLSKYKFRTEFCSIIRNRVTQPPRTCLYFYDKDFSTTTKSTGSKLLKYEEIVEQMYEKIVDIIFDEFKRRLNIIVLNEIHYFGRYCDHNGVCGALQGITGVSFCSNLELHDTLNKNIENYSDSFDRIYDYVKMCIKRSVREFFDNDDTRVICKKLRSSYNYVDSNHEDVDWRKISELLHGAVDIGDFEGMNFFELNSNIKDKRANLKNEIENIDDRIGKLEK